MEIIFAVAIGAMLMWVATKRNGGTGEARAPASPEQFAERRTEAPPRENRYASITSPQKTVAVQSREQVKGRQITAPGVIQARQYGAGGISQKRAGYGFGGKYLPWRR